MCVCLAVYLSVCLSVCLSVSLSLSFSLHLTKYAGWSLPDPQQAEESDEGSHHASMKGGNDFLALSSWTFGHQAWALV